MAAQLDFNKIARRLVNRSKGKGYLTQDEVLAQIPSPHLCVDELDKLYDELFKKGIDVFEGITEEEIKEAERDKTKFNISLCLTILII